MQTTMRRDTHLDHLRSGERFDFLIVGGGATGLGAAVEAASRGWRVALIERGDFAQGTSSRSTKLVHGGVRYLKQGDVALVRDALRERGRLLRNAPHLVSDMAFVIPSYSRWNRFFYGTGLAVYDRLAGKLGMGASRRLGREETLRLLPTVKPEGLVGGVLYHDGRFDDARLAINLARTAVDHGAVVANHCACAGFVKEGGKVAGVRARDAESGAEFEVRARVVVNSTGVFVDELRRMDDPAVRPVLSVSQGVHLVLPREFLPGDAAMMVPKTEDGRVFFAVPWHGRVVAGTTDVPMPGASAEPRALAEEREFLLAHAAKYLRRPPREEDVLSVFAGQRPLVRAAHAGSTAKLSRDHTILVGESGLVTVTGGKWTTYRKMGEDVVNQAEAVAGLERRASVTRDLRIHGWAEKANTDKADVFAVYGADGEGIRALERENASLAELLHPALPYRRSEVVWQARHEMARSVEDVLSRRTRALLLDARASIEAASAVAELLAAELGRDGEWRAAQTAAYEALARGYVFTDSASQASA